MLWITATIVWCLLWAPVPSKSAVVEHYWTIEPVEYTIQGLFTRTAIGVNGQWPIPGIEATLGDTLVIHVTNKLNEPTSLHSHGLFQNGTTFYDGATMVTECGIPPNASFTYRIPLQQTGTYWVHSHYREQSTDGLRTSLIIHDPHEPYSYDGEMVLTMEDWFRDSADKLLKQLMNPDPHIRFHPFVPYGIIGGECAGKKVIYFNPGRTYRLRLLNIGSTFEFHFSIAGHTLRLIELDGVMVKERMTHGVTLGVGQRASVLVTALNTTQSNYEFHADMYTDIVQMPRYNPLNYTGLVQYSAGARVKSDGCGKWLCVNDLDLEPLDAEPMLEPDTFITLDAYSGVFSDQTFRHSFNNITYMRPQVPTALTAVTAGDHAYDPLIYGRQTNAYVLRHMDVVQVTIANHDYYSHPFHLHGHVFQVVEVGSLRGRSSKLAQDPPVKRDTVVIRGGRYAILRFRADNPGVWLSHCHMLHREMGLAMTFIEAPELLPRVPDMLRENCIAQGISTTGNALGGFGPVNSEDEEYPTPYADQFEAKDPPSGWKIISYAINAKDEDFDE
ncbi:ferroxidase fet3 [Coemansia sp. RSA 2706]|nr:ferroxidase fet3 [Coemansia sp. RSA 2711]KAJ2295185.1 ferroxidase fet3 [Coemansia sp. RSA 2706]KAJ2302754.1 ferroxidase fet3 [Coemansia sp. RSA 2705]KAJ2359953.1 ferroxidase fet3 [Coemansia sp. RSA 2610]KAJ2369481.1 ferroxidase fet3 [Coemansia sp. RSA 2611]KAJ2714931.1 ferroxidase fet3 [Coemansia sp. Cherry 401B]